MTHVAKSTTTNLRPAVVYTVVNEPKLKQQITRRSTYD